jgi:hypothetical protein
MTTTRIPASLQSALWSGSLAIGDSYRMLILGDLYVWSPAHSTRANLTDEIAAGGGYTTGGVAATLSQTVDTTAGEHVLTITPANVTPGPITGARYAAIVRWRGGAASADELICVHDMGLEVPTVGAFTMPPIVIRGRV